MPPTRPTAAPPRPIRRRAPEPRGSSVPPGVARVLNALKPWNHLIRKGEAEVLAVVRWKDLWAIQDLQRLEAEVQARILRPESRRHLVGPVTVHDRLAAEGDEDGGRHGAAMTPHYTALHAPPAGVDLDGRTSS
jgi:hypothetical protein